MWIGSRTARDHKGVVTTSIDAGAEDICIRWNKARSVGALAQEINRALKFPARVNLLNTSRKLSACHRLDRRQRRG